MSRWRSDPQPPPEPDVDEAVAALGDLMGKRAGTQRLAARVRRIRARNHFARDIADALGSHRGR